MHKGQAVLHVIIIVYVVVMLILLIPITNYRLGTQIQNFDQCCTQGATNKLLVLVKISVLQT